MCYLAGGCWGRVGHNYITLLSLALWVEGKIGLYVGAGLTDNTGVANRCYMTGERIMNTTEQLTVEELARLSDLLTEIRWAVTDARHKSITPEDALEAIHEALVCHARGKSSN